MAGEGPRAEVGARVRALRVERGLSLSALAESAGIGKGSLSELESGQRNPTLETLYAVAGPLGVPLAALLDFRDGTVVADDGFEAVLLHTEHGAAGTSEVYLLRATPDTVRSSPPHPSGVVEQLLVLEGDCRVEYGAADPVRHVVTASTGDHIAWPADVAHRYVVGPAGLRAVNVIVSPT